MKLFSKFESAPVDHIDASGIGEPAWDLIEAASDWKAGRLSMDVSTGEAALAFSDKIRHGGIPALSEELLVELVSSSTDGTGNITAKLQWGHRVQTLLAAVRAANWKRRHNALHSVELNAA